MSQQDFNQLVQIVLQDPSLSLMRPAIEKEILHYDILFALKQAGLLERLVFQGGTSLRLCYGNKRFSEDLDFCGGHDFSTQELEPIKACLEHYLGGRYGLEVKVKEPKSLKNELPYKDIQVDKWQVSIQTSPGRPDMPRQRIKLEVANVPAYTKELRTVNMNYQGLPDGYDQIFLHCESMNEIMADKLISLPACTSYIRNRDIWDLVWLKQKGAQVDPALIAKKIADYQIKHYQDLLQALKQSLPKIVNGEGLRNEMQRFLPTPLFNDTFRQTGFDQYLHATLAGLLDQVEEQVLNPNVNNGSTFKMN